MKNSIYNRVCSHIVDNTTECTFFIRPDNYVNETAGTQPGLNEIRYLYSWFDFTHMKPENT